MRTHHEEKGAMAAMGIGDRVGEIAQVPGGKSVGQCREKVANRGTGRYRRRKLIPRDDALERVELARAGARGIDRAQLHRDGAVIVLAKRESRTAHNATRSV